MNRKLVTKAILQAAQAAGREHEEHDDAVEAALAVAAPLIAAKVEAEVKAARNSQVLGRAHWGPKNRTNWMLFDGITAYRTWAAELRKARPEVKCEYNYLSIPGPQAILHSAQAEAGYRAAQLEDLL